MSFRANEVGNTSEAECAACGYDLRSDPSGVCPECGRSAAARSAYVARSRRRVTVLLLATVCMPLVLCSGAAVWFIGPNLGLPVGYYGRLNRTRAIVRAIPGVAVQWEGVNYDMTVEEISYRLLVQERWTVDLFIPQNVEFGRARTVEFERVEATGTLTPIEPAASGIEFAYSWPEALMFRLGPDGDFAGRVPSAIDTPEDVIEHMDEILEYFRTTPLRTLHQRHGVSGVRPAGVRLWVRDVAPAGGP